MDQQAHHLFQKKVDIMMIESTAIPDVKIIKPRVFEDPRGYFFESYHKEILAKSGITHEFVQDNQSQSAKGILRGLHFQAPPFAQGKLVRVVKGAVMDVAVDLRKDSPYFGKHVIYELSEHNKLMMWIPEGFAHGFLTLADDTLFLYKCTRYYDRSSENTIKWDDPILNIQWGITNPILSDKDNNGYSFEKFTSPF